MIRIVALVVLVLRAAAVAAQPVVRQQPQSPQHVGVLVSQGPGNGSTPGANAPRQRGSAATVLRDAMQPPDPSTLLPQSMARVELATATEIAEVGTAPLSAALRQQGKTITSSTAGMRPTCMSVAVSGAAAAAAALIIMFMA